MLNFNCGWKRFHCRKGHREGPMTWGQYPRGAANAYQQTIHTCGMWGESRGVGRTCFPENSACRPDWQRAVQHAQRSQEGTCSMCLAARLNWVVFVEHPELGNLRGFKSGNLGIATWGSCGNAAVGRICRLVPRLVVIRWAGSF